MKKTLSLFCVMALVFTILCTPINALAQTAQPAEEKVSNYLTPEDMSPREDEESHYISALIELAYSVPNSLFENSVNHEITAEDASQEIIEYRDKVKDYFKTNNEKVADTLDIEDYSYDVSWSAPYIEIIFEDYEEYILKEEELFDILEDSTLVHHASIIGTEIESTAAQNPTTYNADYYYPTVLSDVDLNHATATGDGIKIGILDVGVPDDPSKFNASQYTAIGNYQHDHPTAVGCLIADIASEANLYFMSTRKIENNSLVTLSLTSCTNILIYTYYVDIINMSMQYGTSVGVYDSYCKYFDEIISTSKCMIVKSAGNNGTGTYDGYITSPGCSMNAITVGSIDKNKKLSYFSATNTYSTEYPYLFKPDLVAPGGQIVEFPGFNPGTKFCGTSYAAPIVTSIAALLMEDFSFLRLEPAVLKSVLQSSCEKIYSQTRVYDTSAGYGLVNYENAYNCLLNVNYRIFNIQADDANGSNVITFRFTLGSWETVDVAANWLICQWGNLNRPVFTDATATIMDSSGQILYASGIFYSNFSALSYTNEEYDPVTLTITVTLLESKTSGTPTEYGAFAYKIYE